MNEVKTLTSYFDKVYCVNLAMRLDRWETVTKEFQKYNLKGVERFEAVDGNSYDWSAINHNKKLLAGELGLIETHINMFAEAIANNYESILIFEDDVRFTNEIADIEKFMSAIPTDWDMIYFGGSHQVGTMPQRVEGRIYKLNRTYTTHCIAIKKCMFETILICLEQRNKPVDVLYTNIQQSHNVYGIIPHLVTQASGYSDIQNKIIDYRYLIV